MRLLPVCVRQFIFRESVYRLILQSYNHRDNLLFIFCTSLIERWIARKREHLEIAMLAHFFHRLWFRTAECVRVCVSVAVCVCRLRWLPKRNAESHWKVENCCRAERKHIQKRNIELAFPQKSKRCEKTIKCYYQ